MNTNFNAPFCMLKSLKQPLVEGSIVMNGEIKNNGYFLIDTGSNKNMLKPQSLSLLDENCFLDKKIKTNGVGDETAELQAARVTFAIGEMTFEEEFSFSEINDFCATTGVDNIIGLLGSEFLKKHKLAVDFKTKQLTNEVAEDVKVKEGGFIFPMCYGDILYGIPVVGMAWGNDECMCVVDTGCDKTTFAKSTLPLLSDIKMSGKKVCVTGFMGVMTAAEAEAKFNLVSLRDENDTPKELEYHQNIQILDMKYIIESDGNRPPVDGLIGSDFLDEHGWILDYRNGLIYS